MEPSAAEKIKQLQLSVEQLVVPRHCEGTFPLTPGRDGLFYRNSSSDSTSGYIDFGSPNGVDDAQIQSLVGACEAEKFGGGSEEVRDESYHRAWKLDRTMFATQFDVVGSGILGRVHDALLQHEKAAWRMEAHLDKLSVYWPNSFLKAHVDTPRDTAMFATLVIILPTEHKGGDLILAGQKQWTFDSSNLVTKRPDDDNAAATEASRPRLAFAAFYSDIAHEVTPVESGYRISITYNLSCTPRMTPLGGTVDLRATPEEAKIRAILQEIVAQDHVLPRGGFLGFGLTHQYPVDTRAIDATTFALPGRLRGSDAVLARACAALGLTVAPKVLWSLGWDARPETFPRRVEPDSREDAPLYLLDPTPMSELDVCTEGGEDSEYFMRKFLEEAGFRVKSVEYPRKHRARRPVLWVTRPAPVMTSQFNYAASSLGYVHGSLVLVAKAPSRRKRPGELAGELSDASSSASDSASEDEW